MSPYPSLKMYVQGRGYAEAKYTEEGVLMWHQGEFQDAAIESAEFYLE